MKPLDETDQRLLAALTSNARLPVSTLAAHLGLARTTVQARLERLERRGVIAGYSLKLNPDVALGQIRATVLVQLEPRATADVLMRLKKRPAVELAHTTSGRFDLALQLRASSTAELDQVLDDIGALDGVRSLESLIHLSTRIDRAL